MATIFYENQIEICPLFVKIDDIKLLLCVYSLTIHFMREISSYFIIKRKRERIIEIYFKLIK